MFDVSFINPFPNKSWFLRVCSINLLKTPREEEKLLVTSNFSFPHNVFYPFREHSAILIKFKIVVCKHFQFGRVKKLSSSNGLRQPFHLYSSTADTWKEKHIECSIITKGENIATVTFAYWNTSLLI